MENLPEQLNNKSGREKRNNPEEAALLEAEGKIKSLAFKEQPARDSFRRELLAKISAARQKSSMKFWQVKFAVPAVAFAFVLAFAAGAIYFQYTGQGGTVARFSQDKIAAINHQAVALWQKVSGHKNLSGSQVAVTESLSGKNNVAETADSAASKMMGLAAPAVQTSLTPSYNQPVVFGLVKGVFAAAPEAKIAVNPILKGEQAAVADLSNFKSFETGSVKFSAEQKKALADNNFVLAGNNIIATQEWGTDDFVDTYNSLKGSNIIYERQPQNAVFISSDLGLHLYHILVDRSFQKLEETKMQPALREMTRALFEDSINNYNQASDPVLKDSYKRLAVYYLVPLVVLDAPAAITPAELKPEDFPDYAAFMEAQTKQQEDLAKENLAFSLTGKNYDGFDLSDEIYNTATAELKLMAEAKGKAASPLFSPLRPDFKNDYTQFTPRSHYTKNNILKSYFIAMMWYGRMGFTLKSPELTRDAILITGQVNSLKIGDEALSKKWTEMMDVIDFFVGESDDLTPYQYTQEMKKLYGDGVTPETAVKDENLQKFIDGTVKDLPSPKILSELIDLKGNISKEDLLKETLQFRFMGQRFTPDAYILNKFTQGDEAPDSETGQRLPSMATALEPISVLAPDNKVVKNYFDQWVAANAPDSDKVIAKVYGQLQTEFSQYDPAVWTQNIYWSWLDVFHSLLGDYGQGYPFFMNNDAWKKKDLGTVLGSYAELKHDTLLYAKQSYAELGAGGPDEKKIPPVPKGYVEPDLVFWNKISNLAELTRNGLKSRNMFPDEFDNRYQIFIDDATFFQELAAKELQNQKISDDDFEKLRLISNSLQGIVTALPGEELTKKEKRAGIVADIHTDGKNGKILYEATGKPNLIYTAIKDINGARLTVGAVYDHYEFITPFGKRLTDEDWQAKVYDGTEALPAEDQWTSAIKK